MRIRYLFGFTPLLEILLLSSGLWHEVLCFLLRSNSCISCGRSSPSAF